MANFQTGQAAGYGFGPAGFIEPLDRRAPWTISGAEIAAWLVVVDVRERREGP